MLPKGEPITPLSREETKVACGEAVVKLSACARAQNHMRSIAGAFAPATKLL